MKSPGAPRPSNRDLIEATPNYRALSVRDLLDARDQYHYHLMNKANVVGTAIGLYLFRKGDVPEPSETKKGKSERRFDNSAVHPTSWPCVMVLVHEWFDDSDFCAGKNEPALSDLVPRRLFLPDGRSVPVCVVKVTPIEAFSPPIPQWQWPASMLGGGVPIFVEVQGEVKMATAGCLVSDGHTTYALTNRHVCGPQGTPVSAIVRNRRITIGRSSAKQLTRLPFNDVYPALPVRSTFVNMEAGLIELDNLNDWTSQVYGLGPIGALADLNDHNLSLRLIGQKLVGYGGHSGELTGTIQALFYRYKSVGGYEYVSDFLIAPVPDSTITAPGDSGMVWHIAPTQKGDRPLPLALEWGGQSFSFPTGPAPLNFALASMLSNVCQQLDVELVQEHNTGAQLYWGQTGHYSIASFACDHVGGGKLAKLMTANLDRISFASGDLSADAIKAALKKARDNDELVPLADVPDLIWKQLPGSAKGGRDTKFVPPHSSTGPEHPTHYADIDEVRPSDHKTLRQLSLAKPQTNLTVAFWQTFYDECGHDSSKPTKRGLLPFRVWQFYDAMVEAVQANKVDRFVCAAGLLAHYVGDACQPLHGSILADGFPATDGNSDARGKGVHSVYETKMIDRFAPDLIPKITAKLKQLGGLPSISSGSEAALATVRLMDRSAKKLPPEKLVNAFIDAGGTDHAAERDALWANFSNETAAVMADGARVLGMLWKSAWNAGGGPAMSASKIVAIAPGKLKELYEDKNFVPSLVLDDIAAVLH
jgi:hypothetical protein